MRPNYAGRYHITKQGAVYDTTTGERIKPYVPKNKTTQHLRLHIGNPTPSLKRVALLVATLHLDNPNNHPSLWVNGNNPLSNDVKDLEWISRREEMRRHGNLNTRKAEKPTPTAHSNKPIPRPKKNISTISWK